MLDTTSNWEDELRGWLKPFLDRLGHKARRRMCPLYVAGANRARRSQRAFSQWRSGPLRLAIMIKLHHFVSAGDLERGAIGDGAAHSSGSARWWQ